MEEEDREMEEDMDWQRGNSSDEDDSDEEEDDAENGTQVTLTWITVTAVICNNVYYCVFSPFDLYL